MKEIEIFDKVSKFQPTINGLFIWMDGKVYLGGELIYDKRPNAVYFYNGVFFIVENNWKDSVFIDPVLGVNNKLSGIDGITCFIDNKSILRNTWNDDYTLSKREKINLESGLIIWETQIGQPYIKNDYFFGILESKLCRVNPNNGQPLWQLDLPENYGSYTINGENTPIDLQGYIGIYNGCLYIKAGNRLILGFDTISGEERFYYEYDGENVLLDNLQLDVNYGVIFSIGRVDYFELNLADGKVEITSLEKEVALFGIETTRLGSWENDKVYFWEGGVNSKFGVFNRETKEIKLVHKLNLSTFPAIKDIKHSNQGIIYVLDGNNSLHVFDPSIHPA